MSEHFVPVFEVGREVTLEEIDSLLNEIIPSNAGIDEFDSFEEYADSALRFLDNNKHLFES